MCVHAWGARADDLGVRVGARRVEERVELEARREHGRVGEQVRGEGLGHHRLRVPLVLRPHRLVEQREVELGLAELLAHGAHRRVILLLRGLGALLQVGLGRLGLVHPERVVHALDVEHHLQHLARLDQPPRRLHVVRLELAHLGEDGRALLPLLALLQRAAEAVEALGPVGLEVHGQRRVLQRQLEVLVHARAALLLAHGQVAQRAVAQHLVVGRPRGEHARVVLGRLLVPAGLDGLVAHVAAHCRRVLELLLWDLIERLLQVLDGALGALVAHVDRVAQDLVVVLVHRRRRRRRALDLGRHDGRGCCSCSGGDAQEQLLARDDFLDVKTPSSRRTRAILQTAHPPSSAPRVLAGPPDTLLICPSLTQVSAFHAVRALSQPATTRQPRSTRCLLVSRGTAAAAPCGRRH